MEEPRTGRRRFLRAVSAAYLGSVAGCVGGGDDATPERTDLPDRTVTDQPGDTVTESGPTRSATDRRTDTRPTATPGGDDRAVDPAVVAGIERRAVPIETVDPDASGGDRSAVASVLAEAGIVGMGEATHGTWEFQALRHRLVRTLVVEHGLRAVAFEDNFAGLRPADEYVRHGEGNLDAAMDAFGDYMFHTAEVRRLLAWLRWYNEGRPAGDRVGVYGVDMQTAGDAARRVRAYLREVDQEALDAVDDRLTTVVESADNTFDEAEVELLLDLATDLRSRLEDERAAYVSASSRAAWALAIRHTRVIEQSGLRGEAMLEGSNAREQLLEGFEVRERMMAENTSWVREFVGGPVAFWAHNSHVKRGKRAEGPDGQPPPTQGEFLARAHGSDYYPLVLTFGSGSFTARHRGGSLGQPEVDDPADGTVAEVCVEVDHPRFFVDFDAASADSDVAAWLGRTHGLHNVGLLWSGSVNVNEFEPRKDADGLVFVRETTPTEATAAAQSW